MKATFLVVLALCVLQSLALPYRDRLALLNSLEVGRNQEPMTWACVGCDDSTKPIRSHVIQEKNEDIRAILSVYQQYTVLSFRYTATLKNVWQDLLWAIQVQDQHAPKGCKVQKQYDNMWNSIKEDTFRDLRASAHTNRLLITGISLGGGLAAISYVDILQSKIFQNVEIVTFGSPRVGNKQWSKWLDDKINTERYFIKGDPIAVLPVCLTPICNYRQTGSGIKCNKKTEECRYVSSVQEQLDLSQIDYAAVVKSVIQHQNEENDDEDLQGIIDHIFGYKKIRDYTLIN